MADETGVPSNVPGVEPSTQQTAFTMGALQDKLDQANNYYNSVMKQITNLKDTKMADMMTPMLMGNTGGDGMFGGAGAGGLVGGLILGSLLRQNGGGGLFGGNGAGDGAGAASAISTLENSIAANAAALNARFDAQAQAAIVSGLGDINTQNALNAAATQVLVAKSTGEITTQVALTTSALGVQSEKTAAANALASAMQARDTVALIAAEAAASARQVADLQYALSTQITADGNQTRALITTNNDMELNRRLVILANENTELRGDRRLGEATRGVEVTTTNNINMMQQQQQQQQQYGQLANLIYGLGQQIRSTNSAINVGSGDMSASPTNTNTNIR